MTIATTSSTARRSVLQHVPELALALAGIAVVLLALGPIGWRARVVAFPFLVADLDAVGGLSRSCCCRSSRCSRLSSASRGSTGAGSRSRWWRLIGGGLIAYVPWHYDQIRQTVPPIHDITTDPDNPPPFVAVVPLRQGEGINSVAYEGAKVAEQQRRAYPDVCPADYRAGARCGIRASA